MPSPGPLTPTRDLDDPISGALPSPLGPADDLSTVMMTADEVRQRLAARERDIKYHLAALKHEATTVFDDVNVGGRPLMDRIRAQPHLALALSAGTGALLGVLAGLRATAKKRRALEAEPPVGFVRARLDFAVEDAAQQVARGADTESAIRRAMAAVPVAYADGSAMSQARSTRAELVDVAMKTAVGFAAKSAMDLLVKRLTGHEETFAALADAAD